MNHKLLIDAPFHCVSCILSFFDYDLFWSHLVKYHGAKIETKGESIEV